MLFAFKKVKPWLSAISHFQGYYSYQLYDDIIAIPEDFVYACALLIFWRYIQMTSCFLCNQYVAEQWSFITALLSNKMLYAWIVLASSVTCSIGRTTLAWLHISISLLIQFIGLDFRILADLLLVWCICHSMVASPCHSFRSSQIHIWSWYSG